jgi:RimJ/RimL family protein N-acetyltransferase
MWSSSSPQYRRLVPRDHERYRHHLLALDSHARRMRFHAHTTDESIDRHIASLDPHRTLLVGVFLQGELRGAAEISFASREDRRSAELAVSVEKSSQRRGLGRGLTERAMRIARNRGATSIWMYCLPENEPMQRIARGMKGQLRLEHATIDAKVQLEPATVATQAGELVAWAGSFFHPPERPVSD